MSVTIIIKSATQSVKDFNIDCDLTWTIGTVKEKLQELYPDNPKKESQKLIYGGKLLPDHLALKSVLNHSQERHIVHLVCPSPSNVSTKEKQTKQIQPDSQTFPVPPINPTFGSTNQQILNPPNFSAMPGPVPTLSTGDSFQQYLAMQQMYAQFMTQYLTQYNGGVPPVVPVAPVLPVPPVQTPQVPVPPQNLTPNRPQRRAEVDDRDYLDYLYIISRAVMLFAVLFYYSSLTRVLIVVSMFIFISVYAKLNRQNQRRNTAAFQEMQRLRNEMQRHEPVQSQEPADIQPTEVEQPVIVENEETVDQERDETVSRPTENSATSDETLSQQTEERSFASAVSTTVSLVSAFFSSLIPQDPVPVNVN